MSASTSDACASAARPGALRDRLPPVIATWLTERFGLTVPIVAAPMSGAANGPFAAAVCRAGGLGMVGISDQSPDEVRDEVAAATAGGTSYGIGMLAWIAKDRPDLLDVVIELQTPFVSLSYGDYRPLVAPLRAAGITVATQIGTADMEWLVQISHQVHQKPERRVGCNGICFLRIACCLAGTVALV